MDYLYKILIIFLNNEYKTILVRYQKYEIVNVRNKFISSSIIESTAFIYDYNNNYNNIAYE